MLNTLAQQTSNCTVNGEPVDCGELIEPLTAFFGAIGAFLLFFFLLFLIGFIFWVISLVHLFSHEDVEERIMWILLVILVPLMQFVYFFGPRRSYEKQKLAQANLAPNKQKQ